MNDIERELRATIERRVADITPSGSMIPARIVRLIRWRRTTRVAAAGATVLALGVAAFMVPSAILGSNSRQTPPATDAASSGDAAADAPLPPWMRRLTPRVELAAGVRGGTPWSHVAFKVIGTEGRLAGERLFCSGLGIGGGRPNALCQTQISDDLGTRTHVYPIPDWRRQHTTAVYGFTSDDVTDVTLQLENGTVVTPELRAAPTSLAPAGRFFVAFVDPAQDIDVIELDRSGAKLQTVALEALPRLTVRKTGSGDGFVLGAETCPVCPQPPPDPTVECGTDWPMTKRVGAWVRPVGRHPPGLIEPESRVARLLAAKARLDDAAARRQAAYEAKLAAARSTRPAPARYWVREIGSGGLPGVSRHTRRR